MSEQQPMDAAVGAAPDICAALRREREARGLSVADVATALKLTQRQVEAMESGRFEQLPGAAFARGFLRNYCRFLGLDGEQLLGGVDSKDVAPRASLEPLVNASGTLPSAGRGLRPAVRRMLVVALLLLLLAALGSYFDWFRAVPTGGLALPGADKPVPQPSAPASAVSLPAPASVAPAAPVAPAATPPAGNGVLQPPRPQVLTNGTAPPATPPAVATPSAPLQPAAPPVAPAPAPAAPPVPATSPAPAPQPSPQSALPPPAAAPSAAVPVPVGMSRLVFEFAGESWVEVRDAGGAVVHSGVGTAGNVREVLARPPFALVIGNAGQVRLSRDGRPVELAPGPRSAVARLTLQ